VIEADFESRQVGERVLAGEHLAATRANDLILYDRGYPAFWLFAVHHQEVTSVPGCCWISPARSARLWPAAKTGRWSWVLSWVAQAIADLSTATVRTPTG